jgi:MoaA/NifB/PqqE/SkfB family radical SAM enzyme
MNLRQILYFLSYGLDCFVLGRRKPFVAGIPLTDVCNLQCRHCVVANAGRGHHPVERVRGWMQLLHDKGARVLYLQGGEPFGWSDHGKKLDDIVHIARRMGFFKVAVVTNGTYPIETEADLVWVSMDGSPEVHDAVRGRGAFSRLERNLAATSHRRVFANMTVNRLNRGEVEAVVRYVAGNTRLNGISVNFHTPYEGVEDLAIPMDERAKVIDDILRWKREGLPIVNSVEGLRLLRSGVYRRPLWLIQMVEQGEVFECCWGRNQAGVCERCGYGVIAELSGLSRLNPSSVLHALRLFSNGGSAL